MSTRSMIFYDEPSGNVRGIYCHCDGYYDYVGILLQSYYNSPKKARELIKLGDLSSLGIEIGTKHDFNTSEVLDGTPYEKYCTAYHRDREEDFHCSNFTSENKVTQIAKDFSFDYRFKDGQWFAFDYKEGSNREWIPLKEVLDRNNILLKVPEEVERE